MAAFKWIIFSLFPMLPFALSVTEHRISDQVTLNCSLSEHGWCRHTVKWLYEGKNVDEGNRDLKSKSNCSVSVTFLTSYLKQSFKCEVTDVSTGAVQQFTFSRQSSGEKTGDAAATATSPTAIKWTSVEMKNTSGGEKPTFTTNHDGTKQGRRWWFVIAALVVAALFFFVAAVIKRKRAQENAQMHRNTADTEGGVSYASIIYTKKNNRNAQVVDDDDNDEGDTVTYSTVKASCGSL